MNIILIGMRGAGKSNVSRRLSVLTKYPALSTDLLIEYENNGRTIAEIIGSSQHNWRSFREMEYQVVKKISGLDKTIIDCGGGMVVDIDEAGHECFSDRKITLLKRSGKIVWLKGDISKLATKVKNDEKRPSLSDIQSAEEVMHLRQPFYEVAADIIIDIDNKKRKQVTQDVYNQLAKVMNFS